MAIKIDVVPQIDVEGFAKSVKTDIAKGLLMTAAGLLEDTPIVQELVWRAVYKLQYSTEDSDNGT